ncbi:hepatocyte growth factor receptor, partial [Elysia marginata]
DKVYPLLTSVVLGSVDIQHSSSRERLPVLVVGFGSRRKDAPAARRVDARQGGAVCVFSLDKINKEMDFALKMCNVGIGGAFIATSASWIKGSNPECIPYFEAEPSDVCSSATPNRHVQGNTEISLDAVVGFEQTSVATLWSYTPRQAFAVVVQKMSLFILTLDGRISKLTLRIDVENDVVKVTTSGSGISEYQRLDIQLTTDNGTWNGQPIPVGATDNIRAFMYISNGNKVMYLSLDYCRQFGTCADCTSHEGVCQWCPAERACLSEDISGPRCKTAASQTCPPKLTSFSPITVPIAGGSLLTLIGSHIGSEVDEMKRVKVFVCEQECDDVTKVDEKGTTITCTVREKCAQCSDSCNVKVTVETVDKTHNLNGKTLLSYVTPRVESVEPRHGPVSGHTQVQLSGQYIHSGSHVKVKVAGTECKIVQSLGGNLQCQVKGDNDGSPRCGPVELTIDNFRSTVPDIQFCLRENPQIKRISPVRSIESGGTVVTIEGAHLNSATRAVLVLSLTAQQDGRNTSQRYPSECNLPDQEDLETMTCPSPPVSDMDELLSDLATRRRQPSPELRHLTFDLLLELDGRNVLDDAKSSGRSDGVARAFVVYRDPTIFRFTPDTEDAFVDVLNPVVEIRGNNVPIWLPISDIQVTIGNWTCPVIEVTRRVIRCNATELAGHVIGQMVDDKTTTVIPGMETTRETRETPRETRETPRETRETPWETRETSVAWTSTLPTPPVTDGGDNDTDVGINATSGSPGGVIATEFNRSATPKQSPGGGSDDTSLKRSGRSVVSDIQQPFALEGQGPESDHEKVTTTKDRLKEFSFVFTIQIVIGNLKVDLGTITLGHDTSRPSTPSTRAPGPETEEEEDEEFSLRKVAGPVAGGALILLGIAAIVLCCQLVKSRRRTREMEKMAPYYMGSISGSAPGSKEMALPTLKDILESIMEPSRRSEVDNLIIQLNRLTIGKSIGSGNFGCVYEGLLEQDGGQPPQRVAVKTLQDGNCQSLDLKSFVQEAVLMKDFRHPHVLGLVGLSERAGPAGIAPYVILPYMENGDLLTYVRDPHVSLSLHDVIKFGADIASGMAYLSALKFVHRDLAARNCMLDSLHRAKVADFGLCRDIYEKGYYTSDNRKKLPIRWMAVESIEHGAYSTKSDVWSFGVVLWELTCRGVTPYPGVDGWDVINYLRKRRLAPPFFCPDELYNMMMLCWAKDPDKRPDFYTLHADLMAMIGQSVSAMPPLSVKRRASEGFTPLSSPTSPGSAQFKLPEVIGPMGRKAMARSNSDIEKGLVDSQLSTSASYKNIAVIGEEVAKAALENKRLSAGGVGGSGATSGSGGGVAAAAATAAGTSPANRRSSVTVVVTGPPKVAINNVNITIPTCFQHRDLSRNVAAEYISLVDNYEPAPKFSNSFKLKSRRGKKSGGGDGDAGRDRASVQKRNKKPPVAPRSSKTKSSVTDPVSLPHHHTSSTASGYSSLVFDHPDKARASAGSGRMIGVSYGMREEGNYFELETAAARASAGSVEGASGGRHSGRSSFNTGSVASLLDARSGRGSSSPSIASSRASTPGVERSSRSQLAGGSGGRSNSNASKQLPVIEQLKAEMSRNHVSQKREETSVVDDEISSCFDTDL